MTFDAISLFIQENAFIIGSIVFLIMLSAFFSGSETALTAVTKSRILTLKNNGSNQAGIVAKLIEKRDRLIGVLLIGNNLVNILASSLATTIFLGVFGEVGVAYATLAMTCLLVVFAEVLPKSWALSMPERFAMSIAGFVRAIVFILGPFSSAINWIVRQILRAFGVNLTQGKSMLSAQEELRGTVDLLHKEGSFVKADKDRLGGVLDLGELEVSDIMVHRTTMQMVNADEKPEIAVKAILESPYTRIPIWSGDKDNIIGIVHAKDLLRALVQFEKPENIDISKIAKNPWYVPDSTNLNDQLSAFLRNKRHFAIVVDEYGEVEGLVTLEDILEEIVGDIADEHDLDIQGVHQQADGSVIVDGSVPIRDLNRAFDWNLPDEEATTIAGLVIHEAQKIPEEKQAFTYYGMQFFVIKRHKNRIATLRLRPSRAP